LREGAPSWSGAGHKHHNAQQPARLQHHDRRDEHVVRTDRRL